MSACAVRILSVFGLVAAFALQAADDPKPAVTDGEVWNLGVTQYRAGDFTNALETLRPLLLSKTHGARAAEVVAKIAHDEAHTPGRTNALERLEEAAAAAQIALRANPTDARINRNFTRAIDGLKNLREEQRITKVLEAAKGKDPGALLQAATQEVRELLRASGTYLTNDAPKAVELADALGARARRLSDAWLPVKELIAQSVTNEEQAATIIAQTESARAKTEKAATALADMTEGAYAALADAEHDFTRFLKLSILPPAAIREDLVCQSNAWQDVAAYNGRSWQQDALDYTRAFRAKFPAWAKAYEQQAQADTNKPPFTAEAQAKVSGLATELEKIQIDCVKNPLPPEQEKALELIRKIIELLPNDGKGGGGNQPQQQQNQNQNQQQNRQDQQNQKDQQNQQDQQAPGEDEKKQDKEDERKSPGEERKDQEQKDVEALLKKAQERSNEHEAEKKARMRKAALPPSERDW